MIGKHRSPVFFPVSLKSSCWAENFLLAITLFMKKHDEPIDLKVESKTGHNTDEANEFMTEFVRLLAQSAAEEDYREYLRKQQHTDFSKDE